MTNKHNIHRHWKLVLYLSAFFLMAFIVQDIIREVVIFRKEANLFQQNLMNEVKLDVYNEVNYRYDEVDALIETIDEEFEQHLINHLEPLHFTVSTVNNTLQFPTDDELEQALINTVRSYSLNDVEHNYYLFNQDGIEVYDSAINQVTNIDRFNETDDLNRFYIKLLLDNFNQGEVTALQRFYKIDSTEDKMNEFLMHATKIEDTNYIIATIEEKNIFALQQRELFINRLNEYYQQDGDYVYVLSDEKEILFHLDTRYQGVPYDQIVDVTWKNALDTIYDFVLDKDEGYVEYRFYENAVDGNTINRTAFVKTVDEWNIIIGSSVDSHHYDYLVTNYIQDSYKSVLSVKIPIYAILILTAVLIFRFINKLVSLSILTIQQEEDLYRKFADLTSEIIIITDMKGDIIFTNNIGMNIMYSSKPKDSLGNIDRILGAENGYSKLYGINDTYYVKYNKEQITLDNQSSELYIVTDVTEKVRTEQKLQALSQHDDLTDLGNRRRMVQDYETTMIPYTQSGETAYLVMIDLDNFKEANNLYGHQFGDEVLQIISNIFISSLPSSCSMYRIGGDEFIIFAMDITRKQLVSTLEGIHTQITSYSFDKPLDLGFSAGIAPMNISDKKRRLSDYYEYADKKLYEAKQSGKGTIIQ